MGRPSAVSLRVVLPAQNPTVGLSYWTILQITIYTQSSLPAQEVLGPLCSRGVEISNPVSYNIMLVYT